MALFQLLAYPGLLAADAMQDAYAEKMINGEALETCQVMFQQSAEEPHIVQERIEACTQAKIDRVTAKPLGEHPGRIILGTSLLFLVLSAGFAEAHIKEKRAAWRNRDDAPGPGNGD